MALPALLAAGVIGFVLGVIGSDQYEKDCAERRKAAEDSHLTDEADKDCGSSGFYSDEDEEIEEYEDKEEMEEYESDGEEDEDGARQP